MPTLNWIGKEAVVNHHRHVPYRLLHCDKSKSAGDPEAGNLLVQGDNLEALKALLPYYAGKVKCIYIDPPYNTGNESWIYNDNVNSPQIKKWLGQVVGKEAEDLTRHDKWLCMMYPRLALLREFLSEDGIIFVSINEKELQSLRLLMDEVFQERNFLTYITVKTSDPSGHKTVNPAPYDQVEFLLMYGKTRGAYKYRQQYVRSVYDPGYNRIILNPDEHYSSWKISGLNDFVAKELGYASTREATKNMTKPGFLEAVAMSAQQNADRVFQPTAISSDAGRDIVALRDKSSTSPGDLVLDSFAGSGTTAAAAQKMERRWIAVEMEKHAVTHIAPRLEQVIAGNDKSGITEVIGWKGGGGFRFCTLGKPLFDEYGSIDAEVKYNDLAAHVFFSETGSPLPKRANGQTPLLGTFEGRAVYLLFNGILGDRKPGGGNVLSGAVLESLAKHEGPKVVYGEACRLGKDRLRAADVTFKQVPWEVRVG